MNHTPTQKPESVGKVVLWAIGAAMAAAIVGLWARAAVEGALFGWTLFGIAP